MIRRPPRSTLDRSTAASDVYKRQLEKFPSLNRAMPVRCEYLEKFPSLNRAMPVRCELPREVPLLESVSYTHLRAHETPEHLVCRLLPEKKKYLEKFSSL